MQQYLDAILFMNVKTNGVLTNWISLFQSVSHPGRSSLDDERFCYSLSYFWCVCRCCIVVRIRNGHLESFVPFANPDFRNNWKLTSFLAPEKADWPREAKSATSFPLAQWWANAGILCTACGASVWGTSFLQDLALCLEMSARRLPPELDVEFFLNKRDFPNVRKDGCDPWGATFFGMSEEQVVDVNKLLPVFSTYCGKDFLDLPFPLMQDYAALPLWQYSSFDAFKSDWQSREKTVAIFRGSATGCGVTEKNNPRLGLEALVRKLEASNDPRAGLFDVHLTGRNQRLRKHPQDSMIRVLSSVKHSERDYFMSFREQQRSYKFAIYVEGHSAASRLGALLGAGFLVFAIHTTSAPADYLFFMKHLVNEIHWVQCSLAELPERVSSYAEDPESAIAIAWAATCFHRTHLCRDAMESFVAEEILKL